LLSIQGQQAGANEGDVMLVGIPLVRGDTRAALISSSDGHVARPLEESKNTMLGLETASRRSAPCYFRSSTRDSFSLSRTKIAASISDVTGSVPRQPLLSIVMRGWWLPRGWLPV